MSEHGVIRRLAAVLAADVAGYSRLMGQDLDGTLAALRANRAEVWDPVIGAHGGRVVKSAGDGMIIEFESAVSAVQAAVEIQQRMANRRAARPAGPDMVLRIGITLGDLVIAGPDVFGDGVNIAARLEAKAAPGSILISGDVFNQLDGSACAAFEDEGESRLHNIARPIRIHRWRGADGDIQAPAVEPLGLSMLGPMALTRGDQPVVLPPSKKSRALLAFLAVTGRSHQRDRLSEMLWNVSEDPRGALRWSLSRLRPLVDDEQTTRIVADRQTVRFEAQGVISDVERLARAAARGFDSLETAALEHLAAADRGPFLDGLDLPDMHAFQAWLVAERDSANDRLGRLYACLIDRLDQDTEGALRHARTWAERDPGKEAAHAAVIGLLSRLGRTAEGKQQAKTAAAHGVTMPPMPARVPDEPPVEPAPLARQPMPPPGADTGQYERRFERSDKPLIAVLPFDDFTAEASARGLADGLTEDIITELSRQANFDVVARNTMFTYKNRSVTVDQVGAELGARYVLEGSLRQAGTGIRLNCQLVLCDGGRHLWADRYGFDLNDDFSVQDNLVTAIAATLSGQVDTEERNRVGDVDSSSARAYELRLKGLKVWRGFNPKSNLAARDLYEQALALDPNYCRTHISIAWTYILGYRMGWEADGEAALAKAETMARRALDLDDNLYTCHHTLGMVSWFQGHHDQAVLLHDRALALNPNDYDVMVHKATLLGCMRRAEEGVRLVEAAMRLNPKFTDWFYDSMGTLRLELDQPDAAISEYKKVGRLRGLTKFRLSVALVAAGREAEARKIAQEYLTKVRGFSAASAAARHGYQFTEDRDRYLHRMAQAGYPE